MIIIYAEGLQSKILLHDLIQSHHKMIQCVIKVPRTPISQTSRRSPKWFRKKIVETSLWFLCFNFTLSFLAPMLMFISGTTVAQSCKKYNVRLCEISKGKESVYHELRSTNVDWLWNASPIILTKEILNLPKQGCINFHGAPLPEYRGAANYFWMLHEGCNEAFGVFHLVDERLDAGNIITQTKRVRIHEEMCVLDLWLNIRLASYPAFEKMVDHIAEGRFMLGQPQNDSDAQIRSFPKPHHIQELRAKGIRLFTTRSLLRVLKIALQEGRISDSI